MQKFISERRAYENLRPGDLVEAPGGYMRFQSVEYLQGDLVRLTLSDGTGATIQVKRHLYNWPDVVTGFAPEYQRAYPNEVFS